MYSPPDGGDLDLLLDLLQEHAQLKLEWLLHTHTETHTMTHIHLNIQK